MSNPKPIKAWGATYVASRIVNPNLIRRTRREVRDALARLSLCENDRPGHRISIVPVVITFGQEKANG